MQQLIKRGIILESRSIIWELWYNFWYKSTKLRAVLAALYATFTKEHIGPRASFLVHPVL